MPVRQLLPDDVAAFRELRLRGLKECPEAFNASYAEEIAIPPQVYSQRLASKPDGAVWGYIDGSSLAGVVGVQRELQEKLSHKALVWGMYVSPEHRRKGIGRALLMHALAYAKGTLKVRTVNLGVNTRNLAAISLYQAVGFEIYGTERGFLMIEGVLHDEHFMTHNTFGAA